MTEQPSRPVQTEDWLGLATEAPRYIHNDGGSTLGFFSGLIAQETA